jgi:hypothetical protein
MKTTDNRRILSLFLLFALLLVPYALTAQTPDVQSGYTTVNGTVKNKLTNKKISFASLSVQGTNIGTIANEDGSFVLKIPTRLQHPVVTVSHVGFLSTEFRPGTSTVGDMSILLLPKDNMLSEVVVEGRMARELVRNAIHQIDVNYGKHRTLLTGFYRETARRRQRYINIAEAVVEEYKTGYDRRTTEFDRVQIIKGRKLKSETREDTVAVRLLGGPNLSLNVDAVKNPDVLLDEATLNNYEFKMEPTAFLNNLEQYVVSFRPAVVAAEPLYYGKLYIEKETLAFTRIELSLDMSDKQKVTENIIRHRPAGLIFKPLEVTFQIDYRRRDGFMCLSYLRNEMRFKCDWHRKLFSSPYSVVSEMVVTDMKRDTVERIPIRQAFSEYESFSDKVSAFIDEDFWGAYNIIAPTEGLDKAIGKLKKQQED